ncbi:MAG: type VI secretion system tube protein Hcp [SAR324 cluster bacterium]|nr:type VI secretion system tube protein Hcp [SAR324 cluster bacterium]
MSMPGFMEIEGESQGVIEGSCIKKDFEKTIELYSFEHNVEIPQNTSTGLFTGIRIHRPIIIYKEIDRSTPKLYQALCTCEKLKTVTFSWHRFVRAGSPELFYKVELENASIVDVRPWIQNRRELVEHASWHQVKVDSGNGQGQVYSRSEPYENMLPHMERVSFTYEKITWTWVPDGIEYVDTWTSSE